MKDILFRGKTDDGRWVYGAALMDLGGQSVIISADTKHPHCRMEPVRKETVGQYVGITDWNGIEIFEGDILRTEDGDLMVEYCEDCALFRLTEPRTGYHHLFSEYNFCFMESPVPERVVGNIYDNPELL